MKNFLKLKLKEQTSRKNKIKALVIWLLKIAGLIAGFLLLFAFTIWLFFGRSRLTDPEDILWGVTYSPLAVEDLGLDPDETYRSIVEDLKPNRLRLVAYWNRIEGMPEEFDFTDLDKQVELADANNIPFIISVGRRVPRYPECHEPEWVLELSERDQEIELLRFIEETIKRYDDRQNLITWQIENEPFLGAFGICPPVNEDFLRQEVDLARSLTDKTIMTTESGELSLWFKASEHSDKLGTTLYRTVLANDNIVINYIFPSWYYRARSNIVKLFRGDIDIIVAELQAEPWTSKGIVNSTEDEIARTMSPAQFERNINFTENVGFPEVYMWGVEWWYYEKTVNDNSYYWDRAGELFR